MNQPDVLDELRDSVRALREELTLRFGVRSPVHPEDPEVAAPPAEKDLERAEELAVRASRVATGFIDRIVDPVRARLGEIDLIRVYESLRERLATPGSADVSGEVDEFGLDEGYLASARRRLDWLYTRWWRIETFGLEHVPDIPRVLFVANASGILPWDALMLAHALEREHRSQRRPRFLVPDWIITLPFFQSRLARLGGVRACNENAERLLQAGRWLIAFPEGKKGALKPYGERYRLQRFGRGGFVQLAARLRVVLVPVAIVGAEEVHPVLFEPNLVRRVLGVPLPITPTFPWLGPLGLVPLPSRWRIRFGEPISFADAPVDRAADPLYVNRMRERVRSAIQTLLDEELARRPGVFV